MPARLVKITLCIMILLLCTGCWDALDLENRSIGTAFILDKTEKGYAYYVEIASITSNAVNPGQEQQQGQKPVIIKAEGATFPQARADLDRIAGKAIYLGANQAMLFTEKMAESGIEEYMYRVRGMNDYRKTQDAAVMLGDPMEFLGIQPENATTVGFAIQDSIQNEIDDGHTFHISAQDLLDKLAAQNKAFAVNTLSIKDGQVALVGFSIFDGGNCIGYIPTEEGRGVVYTISYVSGSSAPNFTYIVPYAEGQVTVDAHLLGKDIRTSYEKGKLHFDLEYHFLGETQYPSNTNPLTEAVQQEVTTGLQAQLEEDIWRAVNASQKDFGVDFMSFSETFRISHPDTYAKMDWKQEFPKAEFTVKAVVDQIVCKGFNYNPDEK